MTRDSTITAIETIVRVLHNTHDFECDASVDDALEDHDFELATAGDIIVGLRTVGLMIARRRVARIPIDPHFGRPYLTGEPNAE